jgi:hypothetical protein
VPDVVMLPPVIVVLNPVVTKLVKLLMTPPKLTTPAVLPVVMVKLLLPPSTLAFRAILPFDVLANVVLAPKMTALLYVCEPEVVTPPLFKVVFTFDVRLPVLTLFVKIIAPLPPCNSKL